MNIQNLHPARDYSVVYGARLGSEFGELVELANLEKLESNIPT